MSKVPVRIPGHAAPGGGTPAWQITLLCAVAAQLAAVVAVTIYRERAARQRPATAAA